MIAPPLRACAAALAALLAAAGPAAAQIGPNAPCERACLLNALNDYLAAILAHDPGQATLSNGYRETQNAADTQPGEGLWTSMIGLGESRRYADPVYGEVGYFGLVQEEGGPAIVALRLRIEQHAVEQAEWIVARDGMAFFNPDAFAARLPPQHLPSGVAPAERGAAIAAANSYFEGIDEADGALVKADPECFRIENGTQTVGRMPDQPMRDADSPAGDGATGALAAGISSCPGGFDAIGNVTKDVIDRRFFYDDTAGVVWGHGTFERVPGYRSRDGGVLPWLNFVEIFEIRDDKIRGIYAAMDYLPAGVTASGWGGATE